MISTHSNALQSSRPRCPNICPFQFHILFFKKKIIPIKVIAGGTKGLGVGQTLCDSSDSFSFYFFLIFVYLGFIFAVVWLFSFFPPRQDVTT